MILTFIECYVCSVYMSTYCGVCLHAYSYSTCEVYV
jgi:hypothetical protein